MGRLDLFGARFNAMALFVVALMLGNQAHAALSEAEEKRLLPMDKTNNTRDLGGFTAKDGRRVKSGVLFRSDSLDKLNRHDRKLLEEAKIKMVTDLRSDAERKARPDELPETISKNRYKTLAINAAAFDEQALRDAIMAGKMPQEGITGFNSVEPYVTDPALRREWGKWVKGLMMPGSLPMLFHGGSGNIRTGFAAAILLLILDVPQDQVIADFAASNDYLDKQISKAVKKVPGKTRKELGEAALRQALGVNPAILKNAIAAMQREFGSVDAYIEKGLGINKTTRYRLQMLLLEKTNKVKVKGGMMGIDM